MSTFVVTYQHPNSEGWIKHLKPHIQWLKDQLKSGTLIVSGPMVGNA